MPTVKSAERTLRFLEYLAEHRNGISFSDIQNDLNIPKSSTYGLIQEFLDNDYLTYNEKTKKYYAGLEFIKLCTACIHHTNLIDELSLLTEQLGNELSLTVHAGILDQKNIMYLAKYSNNSDLSIMSNIGIKIPAHCTALGKILLSQFSNEELEVMYDGYNFEKLTPHTIGNLSELIQCLDTVRENGYATEFCEATDYTACVALPLRQSGKIIASFSATFPKQMFTSVNIKNIVDKMKIYQSMGEQKIFHL